MRSRRNGSRFNNHLEIAMVIPEHLKMKYVAYYLYVFKSIDNKQQIM
jgi:hypothetical protein